MSSSRAPRAARPTPRSRPRTPLLAVLACALPLAGLGACVGDEPDLVVYVAMDQEHSEAILCRFAERTGLDVRMEFDTEAAKTVGLVARLRAEAKSPRCDVFWNNEVANTVALAEEGLLEAYDSPSAANIPEDFRDPERRWTGFAARARCLIVNTERLAPQDYPSSVEDLLDPDAHPDGGIARPLTGTTLTHLAALVTVLGDETVEAWTTRWVELNSEGRLALAASNGATMNNVSRGELAWAYTDTDDFHVALDRGDPVARVLPDQEPGGLGTLLIPNTVAIIAGAPHREAAEQLVDYLLSEEVEQELAHGRSAQIPVRDHVPRPDHVVSPETLVRMRVDWQEVGRRLPEIHEQLKERFLL